LELTFTFFDRDGKRFCRVEEVGLVRGVRARRGPPQLVARVFGIVGALRPEAFAHLQRAAAGTGEVRVRVVVERPERLPERLRPPSA
jgi:hypothetical protein